MLEKIKQFIKDACLKGLHLPFLHDPVSGKPSITLMFPYATFALSLASVIVLHFRSEVLPASLVSISFWSLSVIFYMIRSIQKAKIDLDDKSLELEGEPAKEEKEGQ